MAANATNTTTPVDPFSLLPPVPALDNTFGAVLLGTFLGLILFGVTLHQSYRYSRMYPNDPVILKALVSIVVLLDAVTSAMSIHVCYWYLVTNYFKPQNLLLGMWSINLFPTVSGVVMITSQSFFARRVFKLGKTRYRVLVIFAGILCMLEMGFFIAATTKAFEIPTFAGFKKFTWLVSTGSTMAVTADILLTAVLIFVLRQSRTGIQRTDSMIDIMIMYSINTGLVTGIFNLLSLLFAFIIPADLIYIGFAIPGTKLYANTLLAALNSRQALASAGDVHLYKNSTSSPFGYSGNATAGSAVGHSVSVTVSRNRITTVDDTVYELKQMGSEGASQDVGADGRWAPGGDMHKDSSFAV